MRPNRIIVLIMVLAVIVPIGGCATPMSKFHALQAHPEKLRSFCYQLATSTPGVKKSLDATLSNQSWYSQIGRPLVVTITPAVRRAPSSGTIAVGCPATLLLDTDTRLTGTFYYYMPLSYGFPFYSYGSQHTVAWSTDPASVEKAKRDYLISEVGKPAYDQWHHKLMKWEACVESPHEMSAKAFTDTPLGLPLWAFERQADQGVSEATLEACGLAPQLSASR